ncbi:MAG TPA: ATP-binding protein [Puia sp.]
MAKPILLNLTGLLVLLSIAIFAGCKEIPKARSVVTTPDYDKGFSFLNRQDDSAYYYFNKVLITSKDSLQIAMALNNMAICQSNAGDYFGSQERLLASLGYLHEDSPRHQWCLIADYNELGTDNLNLKNYDAAISYYGRAANLSTDTLRRAIALNNKALAYEKKVQYGAAISIYNAIITQIKTNKRQYARVLTNLAMARWRQDSTYPAAPTLLEALRIRIAGKDDWGLNSSYSHLADYYGPSQPDVALGYARQMYAMADQLGSPDDEVEALRKLILLGPPVEVKGYFVRYQRLQDSLETARNSARNQYALIRYEAEKGKAENLRLQRENAERRVEVVWQRAVIFCVTVIFVLVTWWIIRHYKTRRRRIEQAAQNAIRENQLQTSRRVHDVVANGIYGLMTAYEHGLPMEKEVVLDRLNRLYVGSREISYEPGNTVESFQNKVSAIVSPYGQPGRKVITIGNEDPVWEGIAPAIKADLELILQELMINMDKHSKARNVALRFSREGKALSIQYIDDGVGFADAQKLGNGLVSTGNRISDLGGRIIFDRNNPAGLKIRINIPNE